MDEILVKRLEKSKEIRKKLKAEGFHQPFTWEEVESCIIFNYNELKKYSGH